MSVNILLDRIVHSPVAWHVYRIVCNTSIGKRDSVIKLGDQILGTVQWRVGEIQ